MALLLVGILQAEKCHLARLSDPTAAAKQPDLGFSSRGEKGKSLLSYRGLNLLCISLGGKAD